VKYPKRIKHRGRVYATIYNRCKGRDSYRVAWQVAGKRQMASFPSYSLAKRHADALVKDLAKGSQVTALHPVQARDALAALERLRKDYLPVTHRLAEADGLRPEHANTAEVSFYTPRELAALLKTAKTANEALRPIVAIGGLAGLRTAELLSLDWADVWRVPGHIEITAGKSKTRQRRLVEICPALAAWLKPFRTLTSGKLWNFHKITFQRELCELCEAAKVTRKANGLRHAFCTYHFALHANENQTAQQAGNSPAMIHAHYKGLATKAEAEKWFNVMPPKPAKNVIQLPAAINL
jgi:integrase